MEGFSRFTLKNMEVFTFKIGVEELKLNEDPLLVAGYGVVWEKRERERRLLERNAEALWDFFRLISVFIYGHCEAKKVEEKAPVGVSRGQEHWLRRSFSREKPLGVGVKEM